MLRTSLAFQIMIACITASIATAQPGKAQSERSRPGNSQAPGGQSRGGGSVPAVGTMLPDVNLFDETGAPFSTTALKGNYSVLVFGCLT